MNAPVARVSSSLRKRAKARAKALRMPMMPSLERRRLQCYLALMLGDIAALFAGFGLAALLLDPAVKLGNELLIAQLLLPVYLTVAVYNDAYSLPSLQSMRIAVVRGVTALALSAAIVTFITFYAKSSEHFSRFGFTLGVTLTACWILVVRIAMRRFVRWRCGASVINEMVIDDGGPPISLPRALHVSAESFRLEPSLSDPYAMDRIGMILRNVDRVVVSSVPERRAQWAIILKGASVSGEVIDDTVAELAAHGARRMVRGALANGGCSKFRLGRWECAPVS